LTAAAVAIGNLLGDSNERRERGFGSAGVEVKAERQSSPEYTGDKI